MGIIDSLRPGRMVDQVATAEAVAAGIKAGFRDPSLLELASPWSGSDLQRVVFQDIYGTDILPANSRAAAMRLAAVARARNLVVSAISRLPMVAMAGEVEAPAQPLFLTRTDRAVSPQLRMAWTVDDLIFHGRSLWWRENDTHGFPLQVGRVPFEDWCITDDGVVEINGIPQRDNAVILFGGLHEGILEFGVDVIADAVNLARNVRARITTPVPLLNLKQTDGDPLTDKQIDALIERWSAARTGKFGGVSFTNKSVEVEELGGGSEQLMIEARNAAALDIARIVGVSGSKIDATVDKASLNYETTSGRNREFVDFDLELYMLPIEARLSMDDIVPRGQSIHFDTGDFTTLTPPATGQTVED